MKIRDLQTYIFDKVILYRGQMEDFVDVYNGLIFEAPAFIMDMKVKSIGAKRKGVIDIRVE